MITQCAGGGGDVYEIDVFFCFWVAAIAPGALVAKITMLYSPRYHGRTSLAPDDSRAERRKKKNFRNTRAMYNNIIRVVSFRSVYIIIALHSVSVYTVSTVL